MRFQRGFRGLELILWATWLGALWFMAVLVAPGLFKWLPRPEAGLVVGRLFYMLALYSCVVSTLLLALSNWLAGFKVSFTLNTLMILIAAISVIELAWVQPNMDSLRAVMVKLHDHELILFRRKFGHFHLLSSVLYAIKMIAVLLWGLRRYEISQSVVRDSMSDSTPN